MTIKVRLIASTAVLLCVATIVIGIVAIGAVTRNMTERIDGQLKEYLRQPTVQSVEIFTDGHGSRVEITSPYQTMATVLIDSDGHVVSLRRAGYSTDQLAPPSVPDPVPAPGSFQTVPAIDDSVDYRIVTAQVRIHINDGRSSKVFTLIVGYPLTEVAAVRGNLIGTMVVTVVLVSIASGVAGWWITRRGLQPVEDMIDTAAAIADGDLDRRAEAPGHTEMGRLSRSLNRMVGKLVDTINDREAGQARLRRFVADASHELRTPLATVGGYTELYASGGAPPGPKLDRAMSRIHAENQRMARLVNDLLLLARLDEDTPDVWEPCDLTRLARDCVDDATATSPGNPIELVAEESVMVRGDEARLRQVIANLINNTRQHTPPGTEVRVSVSAEDGDAVVTVTDTGPGIPAEHREKVFDRLYRVDPSRSRSTGGSGLGLAIVESIVTAHRGTVTVADAKPGSVPPGTVVTVRLPAY